MPVHPIEFRYFYPEMRQIFTEEAKLQKWLDVEAALAWAHAQLGTIPLEAAEEIGRKAKVGLVRLERVKEIEAEIHHDLLAMVYALEKVCDGDAGKYIHLGATSYDTEDTALAFQLREALAIIEGDLLRLLKVLLDQAEAHRETVCIGRTHGQHALPMTYGMKFALWASEVARHLDRLEETRRRVLVGKMSGAIGTMASFGDKGFEVQRLTMERLGLEPVMISNQIVQRDRHAEMQCNLALIAGTLDKIGREIRNLQRTEIAEVSEPVRSPSSTMPHKRNPNRTERICGLSRVIRGSVVSSLETIALEHERDISNSSLERVNIPEGFILTDYILKQMTSILEGLVFDYENIRRNLDFTLGLCLTERVMLELVKKGIGRQRAHEMLRRLAMECWDERRSLREVMLEDDEVGKMVTKADLDDWLKPENYIGTAVEQVDRVVETLRARFP
ncbi:MAG: adenylosuccinate lyase [Candidatus Bathyarchaeota archaeon]|nr:adenylosuccinate lyase [Candidatus Bathyarchaeota archaeon]MDH5791827.1 adenylosuccinate lyase [Candidatus Bathyarchaeota archaeon]